MVGISEDEVIWPLSDEVANTILEGAVNSKLGDDIVRDKLIDGNLINFVK